MKIKQEQGFVPITITLETEEEAIKFHRIANCDFRNSLKEHCKKEDFDIDDIEEFSDELFYMLDGVYEDKDGC